MPAVKTVTPFTAQLVRFETSLAPGEVVSRLDGRINRSESKDLIPTIATAGTRKELEEGIRRISGGNDFVYFLSMRHDNWLKLYDDKVPFVAVYTIGNPQIAQTIMKHDLRASYNVPPRLLVLEKEDRTGTYILYHLPSSVMALESDNTELGEAARGLDEKLERLVLEVTEDSDKAAL
ncbi:hypothetical protein E1B28_004415 [Marasmius oreades]|uniref:DUF302 domain-containing protein n=1 Tax=Marasmius oreades TaxID=181124 RepID=A0A9P7UYK9_9AGAR|nr:uncharacterized protein E1B28_004415 [Marasmius oreades]KAG7097022.1 hypothetical protein E1B28_004415 [Marasmius oreades]